MPQLRRLLLCLLLALAGGWTEAAFAAQVLLLLSEESSAFSEAAEAIGALVLEPAWNPASAATAATWGVSRPGRPAPCSRS